MGFDMECYLCGASVDWDEIRSRKGIKVFSRYDEDYDINEVRAMATVDAPIEVVIEMLRDLSATTKWMPRFKEVRVLKEIDDHTKIVYFNIGAPWPVSDRDVVVKAQASFNSDTARGILISEATEEHDEPEKKGRIRVARLTNAWVLECVMSDRNKTRVIYNAKADPGGYIPSAIVNKQSEDQPYEALMGMRKMVKESKYIKAAAGEDAFVPREEIDQFYVDEQRIEAVRDKRRSLFAN